MASSVGSSTTTRLSGLVSGMDTDALVKQMLAGDNAKISKIQANIQTDEWKTESYREITSSLQSFYNTYFDTLSSSNMKSENSFASFATSYGATTSTNYVTVTGGVAAKAGTYTITELKAATAATLSRGDVSKPVEGSAINLTDLGAMTSPNNKISITFNGTTKDITIGSVTTLADLKTDLQGKIDTAFGANKILVGSNTTVDGIKFSAYRSTDSYSIGSTGTANTVLGLAASNLSNKVDLTEKIFDIAGGFIDEPIVTGTGEDIQFSINGTFFRFNSKESSMQDIMDEVNSNTTINATMKYDTTTNSFSIKSTGTGLTDSVTVKDETGTLMQTLIGAVKTSNGTDATVTFSDGTEIVRSSNSFTYDGLTYEIKQNFTSDTDIDTSVPDPITATISSNTTKTYDYIKGFVDKYNELIEKISSKMSEKRYRDYAPLTTDEKATMNEDQVKQWETKAKSGLLKNDSILSGVLTKLRGALYDTVEGAGITLSSIGITTSSDYTKKGKLEVNEIKLKEALATKSEQITKLFTSTSDKTYYEAMNSSTIRSERNKESGIAQKFSDFIQDAIRTNTDNNGNKGTLLDKAGIVGDRSEYTNTLFKEMESFDITVSELNSKLSYRESALYAKFTAMESALSKMNEQQSYITQMFSGGS